MDGFRRVRLGKGGSEMKKIAIYGFGRIGGLTMRAALKQRLFVPACVCDIHAAGAFADLFAVDSNYGVWPEAVVATEDGLEIGDEAISFLNVAEGVPDWDTLGVDIVIDCTSFATQRAGAQVHLKNGCQKVLVSGPSKTAEDCDAVLLRGINWAEYDSGSHHIISMASCTTNALAPVVKVLLEEWGIQSGFFSTVHAYTSTQALTDSPRSSPRDSWAAAENIIPSSSGAAKALKFIWPDLNLTGKAYRVPVRTGSIVELNVILEQMAEPDAIARAFQEAANGGVLKGILGVLDREYASSRIIGETHSSIVDLPLIQILDGKLLSVAAWYDNEMGYATRLAEMAVELAGGDVVC